MEITSDPVPLVLGLLTLVPPDLGQLCEGPLPLAGERGQEEGREGRDGDVELRAQSPVVDRLPEERTDVIGGDSHRHPRPGRGPPRGAWGPKSKNPPDQP